MGQILRNIVLSLLGSSLINISTLASGTVAGLESFIEHAVVPDIIPVPPTALLKVTYPSGVEAKEGNELTPTQVKDQPTLSWDAEPNALYTLIMTDPDVLSRSEPNFRECLYWLVGNIPGNLVSEGKEIAAFISTGPPIDSGLHRYVFLVFKQPGRIDFDEKYLTNVRIIIADRVYFSTVKFVSKYNLGNPIAGNFYQAQYDDFVLWLYKKHGY